MVARHSYLFTVDVFHRPLLFRHIVQDVRIQVEEPLFPEVHDKGSSDWLADAGNAVDCVLIAPNTLLNVTESSTCNEVKR